MQLGSGSGHLSRVCSERHLHYYICPQHQPNEWLLKYTDPAGKCFGGTLQSRSRKCDIEHNRGNRVDSVIPEAQPAWL